MFNSYPSINAYSQVIDCVTVCWTDTAITDASSYLDRGPYCTLNVSCYNAAACDRISKTMQFCVSSSTSK